MPTFLSQEWGLRHAWQKVESPCPPIQASNGVPGSPGRGQCPCTHPHEPGMVLKTHQVGGRVHLPPHMSWEHGLMLTWQEAGYLCSPGPDPHGGGSFLHPHTRLGTGPQAHVAEWGLCSHMPKPGMGLRLAWWRWGSHTDPFELGMGPQACLARGRHLYLSFQARDGVPGFPGRRQVLHNH